MIILKESQLLRKNIKKIENKNIVCRVDFNITLEKGKVLDAFRLKSILPTIKVLSKAKRVIFLSHFADPAKPGSKYSFKPLIPKFESILGIKLNFIENFKVKPKDKFNLFENTRFFKGEKENDEKLAKQFASLGEIFINEAFSASHRQHASIVGISKFLPTLVGLNFEREINLMNKAISGKRPLMLILGGAKISTKLPLILKFINRADVIFLGGGLANTFLKAKGFEIGKSLVEKDQELIDELKNIFNVKIFIPLDFVLKNKKVKYLGEIRKNDIILDIGPETIRALKDLISQMKTIIWNGPVGYVENKNFRRGTKEIAKSLLTQDKNFILVGGGDTLSFLENEKLINKFKNISTGGGAMLYYLANETLPIFQ